MLKTRMQWNQARQKLLAENVANADMPSFKPRDLKEPVFKPNGALAASGVSAMRTSPLHLAAFSSDKTGDENHARRFETTPSGNAVSLEDEMMKSAQNQSDFALVASLYQKSLQMLMTAAGRR
jgi:flagellar basal-body rod protein FlgB